MKQGGIVILEPLSKNGLMEIHISDVHEQFIQLLLWYQLWVLYATYEKRDKLGLLNVSHFNAKYLII